MKRLNRVFDAIGFMYPDYRYPLRGPKRKSATSGKDAAPVAPSEPAPKRKKVKVLTHRSRYIEPAEVPEFSGETSSATKAEESALNRGMKNWLRCRRHHQPNQVSQRPLILKRQRSKRQKY
jgi:hypothetical protein